MSCFSTQLEICNVYSDCNNMVDITAPFILPLGQYKVVYLEGIVYRDVAVNSDGVSGFNFIINSNYDDFITFKIYDNFNNLVSSNGYNEFYFIAKKQALTETNGVATLAGAINFDVEMDWNMVGVTNFVSFTNYLFNAGNASPSVTAFEIVGNRVRAMVTGCNYFYIYGFTTQDATIKCLPSNIEQVQIDNSFNTIFEDFVTFTFKNLVINNATIDTSAYTFYDNIFSVSLYNAGSLYTEPTLPNNLIELNFFNHNVTSFTAFNPTLERFNNYGTCPITALPTFPLSLKSIRLTGMNNLTDIPTLSIYADRFWFRNCPFNSTILNRIATEFLVGSSPIHKKETWDTLNSTGTLTPTNQSLISNNVFIYYF